METAYDIDDLFYCGFLVKREIVDLMLRSPEKLQKQVGTGLKASYLSLGILSPGGIEDFFQLDGMFMN